MFLSKKRSILDRKLSVGSRPFEQDAHLRRPRVISNQRDKGPTWARIFKHVFIFSIVKDGQTCCVITQFDGSTDYMTSRYSEYM